MPSRPGGKYKGKIARAKGEATIAAELEAKRRKAYEANLGKLQERRAQELLAEQGLQSEEEQQKALKMAKIAQMFGSGRRGTLVKFWKNWKLGIVSMKRENAIEERKTCWRRSCTFCDVVLPKQPHRHGQFSAQHTRTCQGWWKQTLGQSDWGELLHPEAAAKDRPDVVNEYRKCQCCGGDTSATALGCRCWHALRDPDFMTPTEVSQNMKSTRFGALTPSFMANLMRSTSSPALWKNKPKQEDRLNLSVQENWTSLKKSRSSADLVPEYDPTEAFALTEQQKRTEERRSWSDGLSLMAGSPWTRQRSGLVGMPGLPQLPALAPDVTDRGEQLQTVTHWRTGQKTMLDKHLMKMYVVGVQ